jgi:hypothetical protein
MFIIWVELLAASFCRSLLTFGSFPCIGNFAIVIVVLSFAILIESSWAWFPFRSSHSNKFGTKAFDTFS